MKNINLIITRIETEKGLELNERQKQFIAYVLEVSNEVEKEEKAKRVNKGYHPSHRLYINKEL